jgi:hypothetical protein
MNSQPITNCPTIAHTSNITISPTPGLTVAQSTTTGQTNPLLTLQNTNNTGGDNPVKIQLNKVTTGVSASDVISDMTTTGYVASYANQLPFTRIQSLVRGTGINNVDGSLKLAVARDAPNNFEDYIDMNAGTGTGSINVFKPINSTVSPGLALTTTGAGAITLSPNPAVSGNAIVNVSGVLPFSGKFEVSQSGAGIGGTTMPLCRLINIDNTVAERPVCMEFYKQKNLIKDETMSEILFYGNDNLSDKVQFGAIKCVGTNIVNGNEDGSVDVWTSVNGTPQQVFRFNGADNENNSFRPLDMTNNEVRNISNITLAGIGLGQYGQSLVSTAGTIGNRWNFNMAGSSIAGTGGGSLLAPGAPTDIVGGLAIPLTASGFVASPFNSYRVSINGTFDVDGVADTVRMYMEIQANGTGAVSAGNTFNSTNNLYYYTTSISAFGNNYITYSFSDIFTCALNQGGTATVNLWVEPESTSHNIGNNRHTISIDPLYT